MLSIIHKTQYETKKTKWRVGDALVSDVDPLAVLAVVASGDELRVVLNRVDNLPVARDGVTGMKKNQQTWFGEHAQFIVANILFQPAASNDGEQDPSELQKLIQSAEQQQVS